MFDIIMSILGIFFLSPILLIIAILIKLDSKGPILYLQKRVGKNNHDFFIYKFRTMYVDADKKGLLTLGDKDPRVTHIGQFLRKYKLDELPQLFNVLKGNMSFVGPRPEVRKYVDFYSKDDLKILEVKPGITDFASIAFRDEAELLKKANNPEEYYISEIMPAKIKLNMNYIDRPSLITDIKIILKTLFKIMS